MKKIIYSLILLALLSGFTNKSYGQTPPSPNTASVGKHSGSNVSLYTGTPGIGIPLWTVSGKNVSMPIGLNYQATGIKVEEMASWVGLGWSLNAGGVITRTVRGLEDEKKDHGFMDADTIPSEDYINSLPSIHDTGHEYGDSTHHVHKEDALEDYLNGTIDSEADIFYYSFSGRSGKFVISKTKDNNGNNIIFAIPQNKIKFTYERDTSGQISSWDLYDENGYQYTYSQIEDLIVTRNSTDPTHSKSWYLTEVKPPVGNEKIVLTYESYSINYRMRDMSEYMFDPTDSTSMIDTVNNIYAKGPLGGTPVLNNKVDSKLFTKYESTTAQRISKIELKRGNLLIESVSFNRSSKQRCDLLGDYPLAEISIANMEDNVVKKYKFEYSYFTSFGQVGINESCGFTTDEDGNDINKRLRLDKIIPYIGQDATVPNSPYSFIYHETALPNRFSSFQDHWGYFNLDTTAGFYDNYVLNTLIPTLDNLQKPVSVFDPNAPRPFMKLIGGYRGVTSYSVVAGTIKRINFPSGANTTYEFESHQTDTFTFLGQSFSQNLVGGLRVKKIIQNDGFDFHKDLVTTYEYKTKDGDPSAYFNSLPQYGYWNYVSGVSNHPQINADKQIFQINSFTNIPLFYTQGSPIGYSRIVVKKTTVDGQTGMGETVVTYLSPYDIEDVPGTNGGLTPAPVDSQEWKRGVMISKADYKILDNDTTKQILSKMDYSDYKYYGIYASEKGDDPNWGRSVKGLTFSPVNNMKVGEYLEEGVVAQYSVISKPIWYNTSTGIFEQKSTKNFAYNDDESDPSVFTSSTTSFEYNFNFQLIKSTNVIDSDSLKKYISEYEYLPVQDGDTTFNNAMIAKNILTLSNKAHAYIYDNGTIMEGTRTKTNFYGEDGNNMEHFLLPASTEFSSTGLINDFETQQTFKYDDNLNMIENSIPEGTTNATIWGFNGIMPIASVANSSHNQIAYTGFESDHTGNWTITNGIYDTDAIIGNKSFKATIISPASISKDITVNGDYTLSFWAKDGVPTVALAGDLTDTEVDQINGWKLFKVELTLTNTQTLTIEISGNTLIDELRFHPKGALMTTSSIELGKGVISANSANNITSHYVYDSKNRVKYVKDYEGNIIKSNEYSEKLLDLDFNAVPFYDTQEATYTDRKLTLTATTACDSASYEWFIEENHYTGSTINHLFLSTGNHIVKLRVTCDGYVTTTLEKEILVPGKTKEPWFNLKFKLNSGEVSCNMDFPFSLEAATDLSPLTNDYYNYNWEYKEVYRKNTSEGPIFDTLRSTISTMSVISNTDLFNALSAIGSQTDATFLFETRYISVTVTDVYDNTRADTYSISPQNAKPVISYNGTTGVDTCETDVKLKVKVAWAYLPLRHIHNNLKWYLFSPSTGNWEYQQGFDGDVTPEFSMGSFTDTHVKYTYTNDCGEEVSKELEINYYQSSDPCTSNQ